MMEKKRAHALRHFATGLVGASVLVGVCGVAQATITAYKQFNPNGCHELSTDNISNVDVSQDADGFHLWANSFASTDANAICPFWSSQDMELGQIDGLQVAFTLENCTDPDPDLEVRACVVRYDTGVVACSFPQSNVAFVGSPCATTVQLDRGAGELQVWNSTANADYPYIKVTQLKDGLAGHSIVLGYWAWKN